MEHVGLSIHVDMRVCVYIYILTIYLLCVCVYTVYIYLYVNVLICAFCYRCINYTCAGVGLGGHPDNRCFDTS